MIGESLRAAIQQTLAEARPVTGGIVMIRLAICHVQLPPDAGVEHGVHCLWRCNRASG